MFQILIWVKIEQDNKNMSNKSIVVMFWAQMDDRDWGVECVTKDGCKLGNTTKQRTQPVYLLSSQLWLIVERQSKKASQKVESLLTQSGLSLDA